LGKTLNVPVVSLDMSTLEERSSTDVTPIKINSLDGARWS